MPADRMLHPRLGHSRKVNSLTDFEYRVWTQYLLSADDFGVLRGQAIAVQADHDALSRRPARMVQRALNRLIAVKLVLRFKHQGCLYVYQHDWQDWQHIEYPAKTTQPAPPAAAVAGCTPLTQHLFTHHPGGRRVLKPAPETLDGTPENSGKIPGKFRENSGKVSGELPVLARAGAPPRPLAVSRKPLAVSREPVAVSCEPVAVSREPVAPALSAPATSQPPLMTGDEGRLERIWERLRARAEALRHVSLPIVCSQIQTGSLIEVAGRYPVDTKLWAIIDGYLEANTPDIRKAPISAGQLAKWAGWIEEHLAQGHNLAALSVRGSRDEANDAAAKEALRRFHARGERVTP
jgi:hypothetical protein